MATPSSMILTGLSLIGEKPVGGTLTAAEQSEYLSRLNMMLKSWSIEGTKVFTNQTTSKALTAGVGTYTMGAAAADIIAPWPNRIVSAYTVDGANVSRFIPDIITTSEFDQITLKQLGNTYPEALYWDNNYPVGTINLWPLPMGGLTLYIDAMQNLQSFAAITDTVTMPDGYEAAIVTNFAVHWLAPGLCEPSEALIDAAKSTLKAIKGNNVVVDTLDLPEVLRGPGISYQYPMPAW